MPMAETKAPDSGQVPGEKAGERPQRCLASAEGGACPLEHLGLPLAAAWVPLAC